MSPSVALVLPPRSANFGAAQTLLQFIEPGQTYSRRDMEEQLQWTRHQSEHNVLLTEYLGLIELDAHGDYGRFLYSLSDIGEIARAEYPSMEVMREQARRSDLGQAVLNGKGLQHYEEHREFEEDDFFVSLCHRWSLFMEGADIGFGGKGGYAVEKSKHMETTICELCWLEHLAHVPCDCEA